MPDDPRLERLTPIEHSWVNFYNRRIGELRNGGDPLWDSPDPDLRARSKRANLVSLVRRYGGNAFAVLAQPMGQAHETPEFEFVRLRYANTEREPS